MLSGGQRTITVPVLKSWDFDDWRTRYGDGWQLPYRMDHLERHGLSLRTTDALHGPPFTWPSVGRGTRWAEGLVAPFVQAMLLSHAIATAPVTLALFESEANSLAFARSVWPWQPRSALAVISCWLAEILPSMRSARRALYRRAYQSVDRLFYFSANQTDILTEHLGLPPDRLVPLAFGVDHEFFAPVGVEDQGYVLVVGRDAARDWKTLFAALTGSRLRVKVCCRPRDLVGLRVPDGVEILGYVDRYTYRDLLARARVVVVATRPVAYPSGQSVLLEAMAMARPVVVTATPALASYVVDGVNALGVCPADPVALRAGIVQVHEDRELGVRLGAGGRQDVEARFNAGAMWATVATHLRTLAERQRCPRP